MLGNRGLSGAQFRVFPVDGVSGPVGFDSVFGRAVGFWIGGSVDWTSLRWAVVADDHPAIQYRLHEQCLGTRIRGQRTYPSPTHNNQQTDYDGILSGLPKVELQLT